MSLKKEEEGRDALSIYTYAFQERQRLIDWLIEFISFCPYLQENIKITFSCAVESLALPQNLVCIDTWVFEFIFTAGKLWREGMRWSSGCCCRQFLLHVSNSIDLLRNPIHLSPQKNLFYLQNTTKLKKKKNVQEKRGWVSNHSVCQYYDIDLKTICSQIFLWCDFFLPGAWRAFFLFGQSLPYGLNYHILDFHDSMIFLSVFERAYSFLLYMLICFFFYKDSFCYVCANYPKKKKKKLLRFFWECNEKDL